MMTQVHNILDWLGSECKLWIFYEWKIHHFFSLAIAIAIQEEKNCENGRFHLAQFRLKTNNNCVAYNSEFDLLSDGAFLMNERIQQQNKWNEENMVNDVNMVTTSSMRWRKLCCNNSVVKPFHSILNDSLK